MSVDYFSPPSFAAPSLLTPLLCSAAALAPPRSSLARVRLGPLRVYLASGVGAATSLVVPLRLGRGRFRAWRMGEGDPTAIAGEQWETIFPPFSRRFRVARPFRPTPHPHFCTLSPSHFFQLLSPPILFPSVWVWQLMSSIGPHRP